MDTTQRTRLWPAAVVACFLIASLSAITITAMILFPLTDVKDIVLTFSPVLGLIAGGVGTFFFTKETVSAATHQTNLANQQTENANIQKDLLDDQTKVAERQLAIARRLRDGAGGQASLAESLLESTEMQNASLKSQIDKLDKQLKAALRQVELAKEQTEEARRQAKLFAQANAEFAQANAELLRSQRQPGAMRQIIELLSGRDKRTVTPVSNDSANRSNTPLSSGLTNAAPEVERVKQYAGSGW